jgi:hypothetical protein
MNMPDPAPKSRTESNWARPVDRLQVAPGQPGANPLNVSGRHVVGALQGFGQMWQKTYRIRLSGAKVTPAQVIAAWKQRFPDYWPTGNHFYGPITGIAPGEVGVIDAGVGPMRLSTGVMVIYADDESFTFMTPEGHMFAGWITFSAMEQDSATEIEIKVLIRANDPIFEMGFRLGFAHKAEDQFWHSTLKNLAASYGVHQTMVSQEVICVDPRVQWSKIGNIRYNAAIHTVLYQMAAPIRWLSRLGKRKAA